MIILASKSPRRQQLLRQIQVAFQVAAVDIDETPFMHERAADYVARMAAVKASAVLDQRLSGTEGTVVVAADTAVVINALILGKPKDFADFESMMERLSGTTHEVYTGLCLSTQGQTPYHAISKSFVTFAVLSQAFIHAYWATNEPQDKAGGYAIQGIMARNIREIHGSYSGIMGLPLYELSHGLEQIGYN